MSSDLPFYPFLHNTFHLSTLDREYYRDKILDMLKDGMYYEETDKKADQKTYKMITKLLHEHEGDRFI
jgi:hypothetical protein